MGEVEDKFDPMAPGASWDGKPIGADEAVSAMRTLRDAPKLFGTVDEVAPVDAPAKKTRKPRKRAAGKEVGGATPPAASTEGGFDSRKASGVQAQPKEAHGLPEEQPLIPPAMPATAYANAASPNGNLRDSRERPAIDYRAFIERKSQLTNDSGFAPTFMPDALFDFQKALCEWSLRKGRAAIFADTGLGKSAMQLTFAENVVRKTNRPVLILTPLAVSAQTIREGAKFGIECRRAVDGIRGAGIYVTNYEKLHLMNESDYAAVVADESSILKSFSGATQKAVTRFMLKQPYRLACTATAAPNDYIELGTTSEALGYLGYTDMLGRFFKSTDNAKPSRIEDCKQARNEREQNSNHFQKLSLRVSQTIGQYRLKGHAEQPFWRWVSSWARACRKPSDLGAFDDTRYVLPELIEREHVVEPRRPADGLLFVMPAFGLQEERDERRRTLQERCELVAQLVDHDRPAVVWVHMNAEGDLLEKMIPDAVQVSGANSDEEKEERYADFASGKTRVLINKPKIGAWGLNWQFCNHVVTFASHSHEQTYQSIRRCWRFGQTRPVTVDTISTTGEVHVRDNMKRKAAQADAMFAELIKHMQAAMQIDRRAAGGLVEQLPAWLANEGG